jgi:NMD protein affecting ribosome stability and mRNA decay
MKIRECENCGRPTESPEDNFCWDCIIEVCPICGAEKSPDEELCADCDEARIAENFAHDHYADYIDEKNA